MTLTESPESKTMPVELYQMADPWLKCSIGDVCRRDSVDMAMERDDLVFHAAAVRQVPNCEFFSMEAVAANITGSRNVPESAVANEVDCVVFIDTAAFAHHWLGIDKKF